MNFVRKTVPPPTPDIGQTLNATIIDLQYPVLSPPNTQYPQREQVQLQLELDDGYRFRTWIGYYQQPHENSVLGRLCTTFMSTTRIQCSSVDECLHAIKGFGRVYVICTGYREFQGMKHPKFKLVADRVPGRQATLAEREDVHEASTETKPQSSLTPEEADALKRRLRDAGYDM